MYLATSPKSNSTYKAIRETRKFVRDTGNLSIPLNLRNAPTKLMQELDYGKDYEYAHNYEGNFVEHEFLPEEISGKAFYIPGTNKREQGIQLDLREKWKSKYGY